MNRVVKVLYVNGNIMRRGGIEAFMMNYFRNIDPAKVHIDFLVHGYGKGEFDDEIEAKGSKILHVPTKSKHPIKYVKELKKIFLTGEYDIVHSHVDAMSCWILKVAKKCGVKVRIAHSHNTDHLTTNRLKYAINEYARKNICKYATHCFACSEAAGRWLFGKNTFQVIPNAIECDKFRFSGILRKKTREEIGICDKNIVIGHVGRFDTQKNQGFLIDVFEELYQKNHNVRLLLIGDGWMKKSIEVMVREKKLQDVVNFMGSQKDVNNYYNAMDLFTLPSLFEGLGIVLLEAQINGLPAFASDVVPKEVVISDNVTFLPLDKQKWVSELVESITMLDSRSDNYIDCEKYDIHRAASMLTEVYIDMVLKKSKE